MRFPDAVTLKRRAATDVYGNPNTSWASPTSKSARALVMFQSANEATAYFPAGTDVATGDRLYLAGRPFEVVDSRRLRSPSRELLQTVKLVRAVI